jgi:hypothetical protein
MTSALVFSPALSRPDLLAAPVAAALRGLPDAGEVEVAQIDPALADTADGRDTARLGLRHRWQPNGHSKRHIGKRREPY